MHSILKPFQCVPANQPGILFSVSPVHHLTEEHFDIDHICVFAVFLFSYLPVGSYFVEVFLTCCYSGVGVWPAACRADLGIFPSFAGCAIHQIFLRAGNFVPLDSDLACASLRGQPAGGSKSRRSAYNAAVSSVDLNRVDRSISAYLVVFLFAQFLIVAR